MPVRVSISGENQLLALKAFLEPETFRTVIRQGLKYAGDSGKVTAAKEIGSRYNLKAARIKEDILGPSIDVGNAELTYRFQRKAPTLAAYGFADKGKGATGSIIRGQRVTVSRSFQQGSRIYRRLSKARTPIDVPHGPSVGSIALGRGDFSEQIQKATVDRVKDQWVKGVDRALNAAARRR